MTSLGYFLSCEEFGPAELIEQAKLAEQAGFTHLAISDHYHPWNDEQGNSPFVWSLIGALSQVATRPLTTMVTCPIMRLHPAITAQAAATTSLLTSRGFRFGVGTGEALNEHVLGDGWPAFPVRAEMLEEAVEVMRRLFTGETVSYRGQYYTVDNARLYNPPNGLLPVYVSGFGPKAAELAGRIGDGFITMTPDTELIESFRASGGEGKPVIGGTKVCWSPDRDWAVKTVHRLWPNMLLPGELGQVLPTPRHFEQASELVTEKMVADSVACGNDPDQHAGALRPYIDAGFDEVYVGQIGPHYQGFFDFYQQKVMPRLQT